MTTKSDTTEAASLTVEAKPFVCPKCVKRLFFILRWQGGQPIGVCLSCKHVAELTTKELEAMLTRICDNPKCRKSIPDGEGFKFYIYCSHPIVTEDGEAPEDVTPDALIEWEVCEECMAAIKHRETPKAISASIRGIRAGVSRKANADAKTVDPPEPEPDQGSEPTLDDVMKDAPEGTMDLRSESTNE